MNEDEFGDKWLDGFFIHGFSFDKDAVHIYANPSLSEAKRQEIKKDLLPQKVEFIDCGGFTPLSGELEER